MSGVLNKIPRNFDCCSFGPTKAQKLKVLSVDWDENSCQFARVLLLFHSSTHATLQVGQEFPFSRYFGLTPLVDNVGKRLDCVCLGWAAENEIVHSADFSFSLPDTIGAGEWYRLFPFSSIMSSHDVVRSNYQVLLLSLQLPGPIHRLYINRSYYP